MALHPQSVAFLAEAPAGPAPGEPGFGPEHVAAGREAARSMALDEARPDIARVLDVDADGVPARLYAPRSGGPVLVHLHGGGWVFGDLETHDALCRTLALRTGWAVLAVDYRRAPEHPYPVPLEDCETAVGWLREHGGQLDVDSSTMAVVGDSAGGNLAAGLVVRHPDWFALQVLVYPCVDASGTTPSFLAESQGLSGPAMRWFWSAYLPDEEDRLRPDAVPSLADLSGQPRALVITAEHDPVRDEAEAYGQRLGQAGIPVVVTRYLGMVHGFWRMPEHFDAARAALAQVTGALEEVGHGSGDDRRGDDD